jgi:hypothetical protein
MPQQAFDQDRGRDAAINDLTEHAAAFSPPLSASLARKIAPLGNKRVQGMPGARCARSLACKIESTRVSHHGHTGIIRHSPRNGFNVFLRALSGDRAFLSPSSV